MLNNGKVFWPTTYNAKSHKKLMDSITCDVLVIGGGMSGVLTAYTFSKEGYDTVLIEKERIGKESSSANTGLMQYMSDKSLHECINDFGSKNAYYFYKKSYDGLSRIRSICESLPNDVNFLDRESVVYASKKKDVKFLQKEYEALSKYNFPCELLSHEELKARYNIVAPGGLITLDDAEINPYTFIHRLLEKSISEYNLRVYEKTDLKNWKSLNNIVTCETSGGVISSRFAIYAGGYSDNKFVRPIKKKKFVRSYAFVSNPVDEFWPNRAMIWETARPYLYIRHVEGNRIIVGGLDDNNKKVPSKGRIRRKNKKLLKEFNKLFPNIKIKIDRAYGSRFGETKDGLPFIGEVPNMKNCYMLLGYGGNGTVYSSFGSEMILDMVEGRTSKEQFIFRLDR